MAAALELADEVASGEVSGAHPGGGEHEDRALHLAGVVELAGARTHVVDRGAPAAVDVARIARVRGHAQ